MATDIIMSTNFLRTKVPMAKENALQSYCLRKASCLFRVSESDEFLKSVALTR